jgi:arylsulfatase A
LSAPRCACAGLLLTLLCYASAAAHNAATPEPRPNTLFILADDLGWKDLGCYGNRFIETPNLDRLAQAGMRFTDAYAANPVCAPSRAAILTGQHPSRIGIYNVPDPLRRPWARLLPPPLVEHLPLERLIIAEALQAAGYVSTAIGKWHLDGGAEGGANQAGKFSPTEQGFVAPTVTVSAGAPDDTRGYARALAEFARLNPFKGMGAQTLQAVRFLEAHQAQPFFCYLAYGMPHLPVQARPSLIKKYEAKAAASGVTKIDPAYAAMVETIDESVGLVLAALDELGLAERTIVVFASDNGGVNTLTLEAKATVNEGGKQVERYAVTERPRIFNTNEPLRSEKGTLYEGGIRIPLIVRWPGRVKPSTTSNVPVIGCDFYPTLLAAAGIKEEKSQPLDGQSLAPVLTQAGALKRDALYWSYPDYHHSTPAEAIRVGDYKLIEFFEDGRLELFHLKNDLGERRNLIEKLPRKAAEFRARLRQWRRGLSVGSPAKNSNYDPRKEHIWGERRRDQ